MSCIEQQCSRGRAALIMLRAYVNPQTGKRSWGSHIESFMLWFSEVGSWYLMDQATVHCHTLAIWSWACVAPLVTVWCCQGHQSGRLGLVAAGVGPDMSR